MPFAEPVKKEVRRKAAFRCCRCQNIGVEVHHIVPEQDGGENNIDNAAPLCPNCHNDFGANLEKRKVIFEMRDWWYEKVEQMYKPQVPNVEIAEKLDETVDKVRKGVESVSELQTILRRMMEKYIKTVTPSTASETATAVANVTLPGFAIRGTGIINRTLGWVFLREEDGTVRDILDEIEPSLIMPRFKGKGLAFSVKFKNGGILLCPWSHIALVCKEDFLVIGNLDLLPISF
jgi:hypothetical protein